MGNGYVYGMGYGYGYDYGYAWKFHGKSYGQSYGKSTENPQTFQRTKEQKKNSRTSYQSEALLYRCLQSLVWVCATVRNGGNMQIIEEGGFKEP